MADSAISIFNIINFVYEWSDSANKDRQMEISHIKHCFCSLQSFNRFHKEKFRTGGIALCKKSYMHIFFLLLPYKLLFIFMGMRAPDWALNNIRTLEKKKIHVIRYWVIPEKILTPLMEGTVFDPPPLHLNFQNCLSPPPLRRKRTLKGIVSCNITLKEPHLRAWKVKILFYEICFDSLPGGRS